MVTGPIPRPRDRCHERLECTRSELGGDMRRSFQLVVAALVALIFTGVRDTPALERRSTAPLYNDETYVDDAPNIADFVVRLSEAYGSRYGGYFQDRSTLPTTTKILVKRPTAEDEATLRSFTVDPRVTLVPADYSDAEAEEIKRRISDVLRKRGHPQVGVTYDVAKKRFVVMSARLDEGSRAETRAIVSADRLELREGWTAESVHSTRLDYPPYEAGQQATMRDISGTAIAGACTTGFVVYDTSVPLPPAPGSNPYYGLSAGHCGDYGTSAFIGSKYVGVVRGSSWPYASVDADTLLFTIATPYVSDYINVQIGPGFTAHRQVDGQLSNAQLGRGERLCFQGITSQNNNCGTIFATSVPEQTIRTANTALKGQQTIRNLYCIDYASDKGDSGGPMYKAGPAGAATAAGTVVSVVKDANDSPVGTCFSTMDWIRLVLGDGNINRYVLHH